MVKSGLDKAGTGVKATGDSVDGKLQTSKVYRAAKASVEAIGPIKDAYGRKLREDRKILKEGMKHGVSRWEASRAAYRGAQTAAFAEGNRQALKFEQREEKLKQDKEHQAKLKEAKKQREKADKEAQAQLNKLLEQKRKEWTEEQKR